MIKSSLVWRFWIKFNRPEAGCWEWEGAKTPDGYGQIGKCGSRNLISAHRLSWMLYNGPISDGLCVLHKCDNPSCVNPKHLFLGTQKDNIKDRTDKCRHAVGENNGNSKLTAIKVKKIRKLRQDGISCKQLSNIFSTPFGTICKVIYRKTWKHI